MPTKSTFEDVNIPLVDVWTFLFEKPRDFPQDKVIYTDPVVPRSYSYSDVKTATAGFGKGLKEAWNWNKNDVLLLYTPNSIDIPIITWGTHWAGGVVSPANPNYTTNELAIQLRDCGAKAIVTQRAYLKNARAAAQIAGIQEDHIILIGEKNDSNSVIRHVTDICELGVSQGSYHQRTIPENPEADLAFLVYSSGTTGHPKGVMLSHVNIVSNILMLKAGEGVNLSWVGGHDNKGDRILGFLPFYHIYGLTSLVHQAIYNGLELIVMTKYDLEKFCSNIQEYKITLAYVVPPVLLQLAKDPSIDRFNLSSLRMMSSGAAPLTKELVEAVYQRLNVPIKQGYGLSETSPTTHSQPWDTWRTFVGSAGILLANQSIKYMSEDGDELPAGETGELWIKGPNVFRGYLNNLEATQNALTSDGYFKTGDVGHEDKHGNLFITDRVKELIKYKGFQVPPAELEGKLLGHPEIEDAAVVGVYRPEQATEVPMAYIVLSKGSLGDAAKERQIMEWLSARVANHKRLRGGIEWIDEVPKSSSGKILRRVLRVRAQKKKLPSAKL
ncbi:hypothetical protein VE01_09321 [Pseudogymnoascus verrucosus]|uniref:Phenylacetyl-CoA ligase n=1 Tax=Pseudogymnoascus verrucosus TaxID=342668 RepID=A0A1B8G7H6_9PEZI|nr:uncharacterized protein VE01_09321 [Pseudogymnoascus verrucosus]OBT91772.1 hypothetical protein VE01_09321 [Pseudogymnoascus verrucosus]